MLGFFCILNNIYIIYAEEINPFGDSRVNNVSPYKFPNPFLKTESGLVTGLTVNYPKTVYFPQTKEYWLCKLQHNQPDPKEVFILENKNLRLNVIDIISPSNMGTVTYFYNRYISNTLPLTRIFKICFVI